MSLRHEYLALALGVGQGMKNNNNRLRGQKETSYIPEKGRKEWWASPDLVVPPSWG